MSKKRRNSRKSHSRRVVAKRGGAGALQTLDNIPTAVERICECPFHETFLVTPNSRQIYAYDDCRTRAHRARKRAAFYQFILDGLVRVGATVERAAYAAERAVNYFYARTVELAEACGLRFNGSAWVLS